MALTVREGRKGLPFTLGWWAFTFPVGVLTTGTYALFSRTGAALFAGAGLALLCLLALLWTLVTVRTVRHALHQARLVLPARQPIARTAARVRSVGPR
jgi:tellurite resistance protein TehA-like permease